MAYIAANQNTVEAWTNGLPPIVSLSAVSATGTGTALDGLAIRMNAVMSVTTSAGVSAGSVQLQGSLDNVNWYSLGSAVSTTAASTTTQVTVTSALSRYVRANVATAITGGTVTVSVGASG
jgi:hypothetical protein